MRMVYLAYPIDQANLPVSFFEEVDACKDMLLTAGVDVIFDPGDAFKVGRNAEVGPEIANVNRLAAGLADGILAFLPKGTPTIGVPMEIDRAATSGKAVAVVTDVQGWMLDYATSKVQTFGVGFPDRIAACGWLAAQDGGPSGGEIPDPLPFESLSGDWGHQGGPAGSPWLPSKAHTDDAGFDLVVSVDTVVYPGEFADIPCGLAVELPDWSFGWITGRSSALRKRGLLVHTGIIDAGYRGPLYAGAWNMTQDPVLVKAGERVAQLIVMPNIGRDLQPVPAQELNPSTRGDKGFGSSGA